MIAVISDLHLQHTGMDAIRYRKENGEVWEVGVRRNLTAAAFKRFASMLTASKKRHGAKEVHLVLAGDVLELHRTPLWFMGKDAHLRPYGERDDRLRDKTLEILTAIEQEDEDKVHESRGFLGAMRKFVARHTGSAGGYRVQLHYIPGNHDRLANAWPEVRKKIREMLGIQPASEEPFPSRLDFTGGDLPDYGVRIRHGHEYDDCNTAVEVQAGKSLQASHEDSLQPCLGDYVTIDVAARLATAFRVLHAAELRLPEGKGPALRGVYSKLLEFDDVRPASQLLSYLATDVPSLTDMETPPEQLFEYLQPVLLDVVETANNSSFFKREAKRLKQWNEFLGIIAQWALKNLSAAALVDKVASLAEKRKGEKAPPAAIARSEPGLGKTLHLVVAGHTHRPDQVALPTGADGKEAFYLDTGTWRTTILRGQGSFGRLRAYSMVFCYDKEELAADGDGRRFESWTGHLAWRRSSATVALRQACPYDEKVSMKSRASGVMQLHFVRFRAVAIADGGIFTKGAELKLHFGVDDKARSIQKRRVLEGSIHDLSATAPIKLDPALDGEAWAYGTEIDWGGLLNPDDPLPWGIARLPRDKTTNQFTETRGQLILKGKAAAHLVLEYEVKKA